MKRQDLKAGQLYETKRFGVVLMLTVAAKCSVVPVGSTDTLPELVSPRQLLKEWVEPKPVVESNFIPDPEPVSFGVRWMLEEAIQAGREWLAGTEQRIYAGAW